MTLKYPLRCGGLLCALWLVLLGVGLLGDAQRASKEITDSRSQATVMVCHDGRIVRNDMSLFHRMTGNVFHSGYFRCTDWRLREAS